MISAKQTGFTLVELMITLAIAVIVLTMAVPSFSTMIANNRLVTQTNSFVSDLNLARSEAVKRGLRVVVCTAANPNSAPACNGTANSWSSGWIVFVDQVADGAYIAADDVLVKVGQPAAGTMTIASNAAAATRLAYNGDGSSTSGKYSICDDRGNDYARELVISTVGRTQFISHDDGANCDASD